MHPETLLFYSPRMTQGFAQPDLMAYCQWWNRDAVANHIITTRLSNLVYVLLPPDNLLGTTHTARTVYKAIRQLYGLQGFADGLTVFNALMALPCNPHHIQEFVVKWWTGISWLLVCLVLESLVQSGLLPIFGKTKTKTSL